MLVRLFDVGWWVQGEAGKHRGVSVDAAAIIQLQPSIIILQEACDLCSVSLKDFQGAVKEQQTHDPNLDPYCGAQLITIRPFMVKTCSCAPSFGAPRALHSLAGTNRFMVLESSLWSRGPRAHPKVQNVSRSIPCMTTLTVRPYRPSPVCRCRTYGMG